MVRSVDQQEPSPGRTRSSRESPQVPAARTARLPARWRGASRADGQASGAQARLADQGEAGAGEDSDLDAGEPGVPDDRAAPGQRTEPFKATLPDWDTWAARPAEMPAGAPQSSAA